MAYLSSANISVFPSTRRGMKQVSARLMSESSFVNIINKLIDTDGYVITPEIESIGNIDFTEPFEFNINGYFFSVDRANRITALFPYAQTIYANIYLDDAGNFKELKGQDFDVSASNWQYQGVNFSSTDLTQDQSSPADFSLLLFVKNNSNAWTVPVESRVKFDYAYALGVDGGEV